MTHVSCMYDHEKKNSPSKIGPTGYVDCINRRKKIYGRNRSVYMSVHHACLGDVMLHRERPHVHVHGSGFTLIHAQCVLKLVKRSSFPYTG